MNCDKGHSHVVLLLLLVGCRHRSFSTRKDGQGEYNDDFLNMDTTISETSIKGIFKLNMSTVFKVTSRIGQVMGTILMCVWSKCSFIFCECKAGRKSSCFKNLTLNRHIILGWSSCYTFSTFVPNGQWMGISPTTGWDPPSIQLCHLRHQGKGLRGAPAAVLTRHHVADLDSSPNSLGLVVSVSSASAALRSTLKTRCLY